MALFSGAQPPPYTWWGPPHPSDLGLANSGKESRGDGAAVFLHRPLICGASLSLFIHLSLSSTRLVALTWLHFHLLPAFPSLLLHRGSSQFPPWDLSMLGNLLVPGRYGFWGSRAAGDDGGGGRMSLLPSDQGWPMYPELPRPLAPPLCHGLGGALGSRGRALQRSEACAAALSASPQEGAITCTQKPCPKGPCPEPGACCPHCEPGQSPPALAPPPALVLGPRAVVCPHRVPRGCLPTPSGRGSGNSELKHSLQIRTLAWD